MNKIEIIYKRGDSGQKYYYVYYNGNLVDVFIWKFLANRLAKRLMKDKYPDKGKIVATYEFE